MDFRRTVRLTATALLLGAGPAIVPLHGAMAQMSMSNGGGGGGGGNADSDRDAADAAAQAEAKAAAKAAAPPPAIPGAVSDEATATSGHVNNDMEPTAALFDAINRGDMTSAKEALGRGADLNGKNILGQNPLDMAIDLNRSDITFLLLSMRNTESGAPVASVATADNATGAGTDATTGRRGHARASKVKLAGTSRDDAGKPQRYASDGGVAKPEIGFLGFGGS